MKRGGVISPNKDCVVEYPSPGESAGTRFGSEMETLRGGEDRTPGQMKEVQFIDLQGAPGAGKVPFTKVGGGGTSNE